MWRKIVNRLYTYLSRSIDKHTVIGKNTFIGKNVTITKAWIGSYCSIAPNVTIGPGEHALDKISTSSMFYQYEYDELTSKPLRIGHDVWIGTQVTVLRGLSVGNGAVIGAGSIVTRDVPPYAIVAGVPAKIIRYRFDAKQIEIIEKTKWWQKDKNEAMVILANLQTKFDAIRQKGKK